MLVTLAQITSAVRNIVGDNLVTGEDFFTYTTSGIFTLQEDNVSTVNDVLVNSISSGVTYTYSSTTNKVTISSSLTYGDSIEVDYSYYRKWSDSEIQGYIKSAIAQLAIRNFKEFVVNDTTVYPEMSGKEKYLIAQIASIIMKPDNREIKLPDMTIKASWNSNPVAEMIDKVIGIFKKDNSGVFKV